MGIGITHSIADVRNLFVGDVIFCRGKTVRRRYYASYRRSWSNHDYHFHAKYNHRGLSARRVLHLVSLPSRLVFLNIVLQA